MKTEELMLTNRVGKRMPATLTTPDGESRGLVLILHGLGGWKDQPLLVRVADFFTKERYTVFRFNESDNVVSPDGDFFHETVSRYTLDLEDAITYLEQHSLITGPAIFVGHSMGGLVAAWYASHHSRDIEKMILIAPAISWKSMWWVQLASGLLSLIRGHSDILGIKKKKFRLSPLWWKDYFTFDAYQYAPRILAPTLVISAEHDHTVAKPREHRSYVKKFPHADHSTITWADHDFTGHEDEVVATINQWLTSS